MFMNSAATALLAVLLGCLTPCTIRAAIWDGGLSRGNFTVNDLWSTPNNWQDAVPVAGATTDVVFVLSGIRTTATQNIATPFTLRSLTFSSGSNVTAVSGNALNITNGGNLAQNSGVAAVVSNPVTWNSTGFVFGSGTAALTLNGPMSGNASVRFRGSPGGAGFSVIVNGLNAFTGGALVGESANGFSPVDVTFGSNTAPGTGGIQFFNGNTIRGSNGPRSFANTLTLLTNTNGLANTFTFGSGEVMAFKGGINVSSVAKTLRVDNTTNFDGAMTGAAALTKTGAGTLTLNGNNSAATGAWTINEGTLRLGGTGALGTVAANVNVPNGLDTTGQLTVTVTALNGAGGITLGDSMLTVGSGNSSGTFTGQITGTSVNAGTVQKIGTGSLSLSGTGNVFRSLAVENGTVNLNGGTMQLGYGVSVGLTPTAAPVVNLSGGTVLTCESGTTSIVSGPAGTSMFVDGADTQWNSGFQVVVGAGFGAGASAGLFKVRSGALVSGIFHLAGASNANELGTISVESGGKLRSEAGIVGFASGSIGAATVTGPGSEWQNNTSLGMGGFSTTQLGGIGTLTIADRGIVRVTGPTTYWASGSRIDVKGGQLLTDTLATNGTATASLALTDPDELTSALVIGSGNSNSIFPGTITNSTDGPGGVTKMGTGTVTFNGAASYTGVTRVNFGTLVFSQSFPFATLTEVKNGATLEFTGTWGTNTFSQTTLAARGTLRVNGAATMRGSLTNHGLIDLSGATSLTTTGIFTNHGRIRIKGGANFTAAGPFVNNGTIDIITAGGFTPPPGFVNNGVIIDRTSIVTRITKVNTLVTVDSPILFGGHTYQLQATESLDAPFVGIGLPFQYNSDAPASIDLGETVPRKFYRWKID